MNGMFKRAFLGGIALCLAANWATAAVIKPVDAWASSYYTNVTAPNTVINGLEFVEKSPIETSTHTNDGGGTKAYHWIQGAAQQGMIDEVWIAFDLGTLRHLYSMVVWNYNVDISETTGNPLHDQTGRGVKDFTLRLSADSEFGNADDIVLAGLTLAEASGLVTETGQVINLGVIKGVRYVRLEVLTNHGDINWVGLSEVRFTGVGQTYNPSPIDGAENVGAPDNGHVNVALGWNTALDPADPGQLNPAITKHYVYLSKDLNLFPTDPNLYFEAEIAASGATGDYNAVGLNYDGRYYWKIEEGIDDGQGGTYAPGDPNNIDGVVWQFNTIAQTPTILSQPANTRVDAGANVQFSIEADSPSPLYYQWYKYVDGVSDIQLLEGAKYTGVTTDALTIVNVQGDDVGLYYCTLQNAAGTFLSDNAALAVKRLLAWYQFENTANDSAGVNHGTEIGRLDYSSDVIVATDGQAYAADPNGTSYIELSTDAYPKAGFGRGLEMGTISFWIKTISTAPEAVLGVLNPLEPVDDRTMLHVMVPYNASGQMRFYLRDFNNRFVELLTTSTAISNNQWHHVVFTYDTSDVREIKAYFDGELVGSVSVAQDVSNFTAWQFPMTLLAQNARGIVSGHSTGQIDDLKFYNYVLSQEAIAQTTSDVSGKNPCIAPISSEFDYDDNCTVDLVDFAEFAAQWLDCGLLVCD